MLLPTVTNQMCIILSIRSKNSTEQNRTSSFEGQVQDQKDGRGLQLMKFDQNVSKNKYRVV